MDGFPVKDINEGLNVIQLGSPDTEKVSVSLFAS